MWKYIRLKASKFSRLIEKLFIYIYYEAQIKSRSFFPENKISET